MQNQIKYFYDLNIINIIQKNNIYYINDSFILAIISIEKINNYVINNKNYEIIKTKFNSYYSEINSEKYVLLHYKIKNKEISINDLYNSYYVKEDFIDWKNKWSYKIDYMEYYIDNNYNNNIYFENMPYYIGMAENAIQLVEKIKNKLYIQHFRTTYNQELYIHEQPNNIIVDIWIRDICEYIKSAFFNNNKIYPEIRLNNVEKKLFLARMLYPSYYFDEYKENNELDYIQINKYLIKSKEYEDYILELCNLYSISHEIEWLKNNPN